MTIVEANVAQVKRQLGDVESNPYEHDDPEERLPLLDADQPERRRSRYLSTAGY